MSQKIKLSQNRKDFIKRNYQKYVDGVKSATPNEQKYLNKINAGKASQKSQIRNEKGQFVSPIFTAEITKTLLAVNNIDTSKINADKVEILNTILTNAGLKKEDVKKFYEENKKTFLQMYETGGLTGTSKTLKNTKEDLKDYKGKIFVNNGTEIYESTAENLRFKIMRLNNFCKSNFNCVEMVVFPRIMFKGELVYSIPSNALLLEKIKEELGLDKEDELEDVTAEELREAIRNALKNIFKGQEKTIELIVS